MKLLVFTDADARSLLEQLEIKALKNANLWAAHSTAPDDEVERVHRAFHFIVTRWLQELGAEVRR